MTDRYSFFSSSIACALRVARDPETAWQLVHDEIVKYRQRKGVSIKSFLEMCALPQNGYYEQLCSANGNSIHPSNKPGSDGRQFLDAVATLFEKLQSDPPPRELHKDDSISDLHLQENDDLRQSGILCFRFDVTKSNITASWLNSAPETNLKDYLREFSIDNDALEVEYGPMEFL